MALFMGLVSIAEAAGGMRFLARITGPFFSKLFPDLPKGHPAMGHMVMNFSANLLGSGQCGYAFCPKGDGKSAGDQSRTRTRPPTARSCSSVCISPGLQLIPVSVIALRAANGAPDPTDVFIPIVIATFLTTLASMCIVAASSSGSMSFNR